MKKIRILALILAVLSVICIGVLASCDDETEGGTCANGEHEWAKWVSNRDASCETDGTHTRKCAKCGEKQTEVEAGSAYGEHTYGSAVSNGDATCENDGTETLTCILCKKPMTRTEEGSALGHAYGKEPISTANGYSVVKCLRCDHTSRTYSGVVDQNFEGGFALEDYSEQLTVSEKADWSIKTESENSYLFIRRGSDKVLGNNAFALSMTPDYELYRNGKYVVEYKILISENTKDLVLLVGKKGDAEQVFAEYDADDGKIKVQGEAVYDVTKGSWLTLAFVLNDRDRNYDLYADGHQVISAAAYTNTVYYTNAALESLSVRMATANKTASDFGIDDIKTYAADKPTTVIDSLVKEKATVTVGSYTISYIKPTEGCEHEWSEYATVAPTCHIAGYQVKTCSKCGGQEVNEDTATVTAPAAHEYETIKDVAATCTEDGYQSRKCKNCGAKKIGIAKAEGHKDDGKKAVVTAPTCTEQGYTTKHCSVCDQDYQDTFVDALGHKWAVAGEEGYTAPACTVAGHTVCTRPGCDAEKDIDALGHDWATAGDNTETDKLYTAPTCEVDGCAKCKREGCTETNTIEKLGHVLKFKVDTENKKLCWACTREECAHSEDVTYATALPSYTELIKKLETLETNVLVKLDLSDDTLTGDLGYKVIEKVQFCGGTDRKQKWNVLDNEGNDGVGKYAKWYSSDGSKHSYINIGTTDDSLKWTNSGIFEFAVRLGDPGVDGKYFQDNVLQMLYRENGSIKSSPSIAHFDENGNFVFGSGDNAVTVSLSKENFTRIAIAVDQTNKTLDLYIDGMLVVRGMENKSIPAEISELRMFQSNANSTVGIGSWYDVANIVIYEGVVPTDITGVDCTVFGADHTEKMTSEEAPYEPNVVDPTCTEGGYTERVCSVCGKTYITDEKDPNGHDLGTKDADGNITYYEDDKKDPTCTEAGYLKAKCKVCEQWVTISTENALDHKWAVAGEDGYTAPDCTAVGHTVCTREGCDAEKDINALGHDWAADGETDTEGNALYKAATCAEDGFKKCKRCDAKETLAKLEHILKLKADTENKKLCWACTNTGCTHSEDVTYATALPSYIELIARLNELGSKVMEKMDLSDSSLTGDLGNKTIGKIQYKVGTDKDDNNNNVNKWNVLDNSGADGVDKFVRWYGNSKTTSTSDGHSYINIGTWDKSLNWTNPGVFEFAIRLGEPGTDGKYFQGNGMEILFRVTEGTNKGPNGVGIGGFTADGEFYFGSGSNKVTVKLSKENFTRIALAIDPQAKTIDLYVDGMLTYKGYTFTSATNKLTEIRLLQSSYNSTVGLNSYYDIANIAIYEGETPTHITGCICDVINAEHVYEVSEVVAPTCTEAGYTVEVCKNCGDTKITTPTEAKGHDLGTKDEDGKYTSYYTEDKKDATCTEKGYLKARCKDCEEWILIEEYDLIDHDLGTKDENGNYTSYYTEDKKDPTCTEAGYLKAKCKVCEQWVTISTENALDHKWAVAGEDGYTAPTCTEKGQTTCTVDGCGATKDIDATGHSYATADEEGYTAPTCTADGSAICKNNGCGTSETIAKLGHSYKLKEKQSGKLYVTCDREGCEYKKKVEFVESFPTYAELMSKVTTLANTSLAGMTLVDDTVSTTSMYLGTGHIWMQMTGNKYGIKNDNIEDDGIEEYLRWYGHSAATDGHSYINIGLWNNRVTYSDNVVFEFALRLGEPDKDGKYFAGSFDFINRTGTDKFTSFGWMDASGKLTVKDGGANSSTTIQFTKDEFTRVAFVVDVKSGTMSVYKDGVLIAKELKIALANADGTGYAAITEMRVLQHPGNSAVGIGSYYDIANIAVYEGIVPYAVKGIDYCAINGHTPNTGVVTAPTCEADGYTTYTCTVCKETYTGDIVTKLGHDMQIDNENSTYDCIEGGKYVRKCSRCDHTEEEIRTATGSHVFTNKVKDTVNSIDATCEDAGITYYICEECGKSGKDCAEGTEGASKVEKATGHDFANSKQYDSEHEPKACEENAYRYKLCKNCGASGYDHQDAFGAKLSYINPADHTPGEEIVVEATASANGSCKQYCTVCNKLLKDEVLIYVAEGENELTYTWDGGLRGYVVTGCTGDSDTITIPAVHPVDGKPIKGVVVGALAGYKGKEIKIVLESPDLYLEDFFGEADDGATEADYLKVTYCFCFEEDDANLDDIFIGDEFVNTDSEAIDESKIIFGYINA